MNGAEAISDTRLIDIATRQRPVFRQAFNTHVRELDRIAGAETWSRYWSRPDFQAAYDARIARDRAERLPC